MTLDEAIKHAEEVAEEQEKLCKVNDSFNLSQPKWKECAKEHRQLAEWLKELKQLREQEPCEDCVSRKKVLNTLFYNSDNNCEVVLNKELQDRIKTLPPVKPTQRWIPVSERLPKPFTYVNATCRSLVDGRENWVVETMYLPIPKENNEQGYSDWGNIPMLNWGKAEVIAWMERKIPEPYKGSEEG